MRITYNLYRGTVDREMHASYIYRYETSGDFMTVKENPQNGSITILPSFALTISRGYDQDRLFVTSNQYFGFAILLKQGVDLIRKHMYELFPNADAAEFEIDPKTMERFQTEKALANDGFTIMPDVFVDKVSQCYPGLRITSTKSGFIKMALKDAIPLSEMLVSTNPHLMSLDMLRLIGKFG